MKQTQLGGGGFTALRIIWHLPDFIKLYWRLFRDRRVPIYLKGMLVAVIAYVISPIDLIPDFFGPLLGIADDIVILLIALKFFIVKVPREVVDEHLQRIGSGQ